ncbi:MAG TPA: dihydrodipicolinate reductase C-terminal domain-containing protein [Gemmatimonadaceae bacterium]|nr:dihydrodipicolinate reductase C-terminal domain-containing protein [Gemmatimonadaceae bacterium]
MARLAVIGLGKMGRTIELLAPERGFDVVARIDPAGGDAPKVTVEALNRADVAVEFSVPGAAPVNIAAAIQAGCPIVVGTTGWYDKRGEIEKLARDNNGALIIAPNFSIGVAAFGEIVKAAARALRTAPGFDAHITETHHAAKKDAPSGTAANIARLAGPEWGRDIPISSIRTGSVPGTHELLFDGPFEQIRLEHVARDRRVFADGALLAAKWLIGRHGVFTMTDVLAG